MSGISTHVLDTVSGTPAGGMPVVLERRVDGRRWEELARTATDTDGRVSDLADQAPPGTYRLTFDTAARSRFFPEVTITFTVSDGRHHHVPLLLGGHQYTTYRGS